MARQPWERGDSVETKMLDDQDIEKRFTYHTPTADQPEKYGRIRDEAKALAVTLNDLCPPSRELSVALTALEDSVMWANAAIARNEG